MDDSKRAMEADACWVNIGMNGSLNERHQRWRRAGGRGVPVGRKGERGCESRSVYIDIGHIHVSSLPVGS